MKLKDEVVYRIEFNTTRPTDVPPDQDTGVGGGKELLFQISGSQETYKVTRVAKKPTVLGAGLKVAPNAHGPQTDRLVNGLGAFQGYDSGEKRAVLFERQPRLEWDAGGSKAGGLRGLAALPARHRAHPDRLRPPAVPAGPDPGRRGLRSLIVVMTAFTLAHSLTLGLAALGVWAPSPRLVEPVIALSIAYVGVENWFVRDAHRRWLVTFPFGLVHGFGFAGALGEIALPSGQLPVALAAFNLGVEAGQVAVLAVALPAVLFLRSQPWFGVAGLRAVSAAITVAGLSWFALRIA